MIFFAPQEVSHWSLWTSIEPNDTQTTAWVEKFYPHLAFFSPPFLHRPKIQTSFYLLFLPQIAPYPTFHLKIFFG